MNSFFSSGLADKDVGEANFVPELVRRVLPPVIVPPEELLAAARTRARRLQLALTVILSVNLAVVSGAITFWALALRG